MKFRVLPKPVSLLKFMLNLFCMISVQGRELYGDCIKCTVDNKLGMMLDATKFYVVISV